MIHVRFLAATVAVATISAANLACPALAASFNTLYTFQQTTDGGYPFGALVPGPNGSFFGTSDGAGSTAPYGVVFQISPPGAGSTHWSFTTLYTFTGGKDGAYPAGIVRAASGALYGATFSGGTNNAGCGSGLGNGCGTIFALAPPAAANKTWTFSLVHSFARGLDGAFPQSPPIIGAGGVLYGTAEGGGKCAGQTYGCGIAYKFVPPASAGAAWKETVLHVFAAGLDGADPKGSLVLGKNGVLYGTTAKAGISTSSACKTGSGCGTVFRLTPPAAGATSWTGTTLYEFTGAIGANVIGGLALDSAGNLYGTAHSGGALLVCPEDGIRNAGCGSVFEISPPATGTTWTGKLLYAFRDGPDGSRPWDAPLLVGGSLYLTSSGDEVKTDGSIIRLSPPAAGGTAWKETMLYTFHDTTDSDDPVAPLVLKDGILYGVAEGDGQGPAPAGTIFSVTP